MLLSHHCPLPHSLGDVHTGGHLWSEEVEMSWFENVTACSDTVRVRQDVLMVYRILASVEERKTALRDDEQWKEGFSWKHTEPWQVACCLEHCPVTPRLQV